MPHYTLLLPPPFEFPVSVISAPETPADWNALRRRPPARRATFCLLAHCGLDGPKRSSGERRKTLDTKPTELKANIDR